MANRDEPTPAEIADLERRLDAGEWLLPGEVGRLFGKPSPRGRFAVNNWLRSGKIGYRRTPGGFRECDPEDVRRLLDEYRRKRRGR